MDEDRGMGAITQQAGNAVEHFGERIRPGKYGYRLAREQYALPNKVPSSRFPREMYTDAMWAYLGWMFEDEDHTQFSDEYCRGQREDALENFDLNMAFFAKLSTELFEEALAEMLRKHK